MKFKANVMIAKVYNTILGEMRKTLVVFKEGKVYESALFWPMEIEEMIMEVVSVKHVEGTVLDVMLEAYSELKINDMLAKDDRTLQVMLHWQYIHGFSEELFTDVYGTENDTEYLEKIRKENE